MAHTHRVKMTEDQPFNGPVTEEAEGRYAQNPAAYGCICRVDTCSCGATRRTNINQGHREYGKWEEKK